MVVNRPIHNVGSRLCMERSLPQELVRGQTNLGLRSANPATDPHLPIHSVT